MSNVINDRLLAIKENLSHIDNVNVSTQPRSRKAPQPYTARVGRYGKWVQQHLPTFNVDQVLTEIKAKTGDKNYLITTSNGHRYFESGFTEQDAISKLTRHSSYCGEEVLGIEEFS